ncbi:hypothetical protein CERSUDRAFT_93036 [Gelatoporia subvermispora B]|uniref:Uncharacterized protein n=1 Tax=Ceriporiopsis subvermispora (strain B) TaxID=914234 RepID=M2RJN1_CERS8|nr:hypothetical protein CERSUDRAFT_93036 [Gelatoporia subvermispora B]
MAGMPANAAYFAVLTGRERDLAVKPGGVPALNANDCVFAAASRSRLRMSHEARVSKHTACGSDRAGNARPPRLPLTVLAQALSQQDSRDTRLSCLHRPISSLGGGAGMTLRLPSSSYVPPADHGIDAASCRYTASIARSSARRANMRRDGALQARTMSSRRASTPDDEFFRPSRRISVLPQLRISGHLHGLLRLLIASAQAKARSAFPALRLKCTSASLCEANNAHSWRAMSRAYATPHLETSASRQLR